MVILNVLQNLINLVQIISDKDLEALYIKS